METAIAAPLTATLTREQFAEFCCSIWSSHEFREWASSDDALWQGIFNFEMRRRFNDGHPYCKSGLEIGPKGRSWSYMTTSGTVLSAKQKVLYEGEYLRDVEFKVSIPAHRAEGIHAGFLKGVIEGDVYFHWSEMYYSKEGTREYAEARRRGLAIATDPEEIARIAALREERKSRRAHQLAVLTDEDLDYDDPELYEDCSNDDYEE